MAEMPFLFHTSRSSNKGIVIKDNKVESATPNEAVFTSPWYSLAPIATILPTGMPNVIVTICTIIGSFTN